MNTTNEKRRARRLAALDAALYAAGRPVDIDSLKSVVHTRSDRVIRKLVRALAKIYDERESSLEVRELPGDRIVLRLRTKFTKMMMRFAKRPLLTLGPLKTLSYIAFYQPIEQRKVAAERGSHIYAHLNMMERMGLIIRERNPDTGVVVRTTPYFADYFGFSQDPIKSRLQLRRIFNSIKITKLENGDGNGLMEEPMDDVTHQPEALPNMLEGVPDGLVRYPTGDDGG